MGSTSQPLSTDYREGALQKPHTALTDVFTEINNNLEEILSNVFLGPNATNYKFSKAFQ